MLHRIAQKASINNFNRYDENYLFYNFDSLNDYLRKPQQEYKLMRIVGKFYDDKNFPRGFNRSGVFTINEASMLENYGRTMRGLQDGSVAPIDESERQFLAEVNGQQDVMSEFGKCWIKYLNRTTTKERRYTLCDSPRRKPKGLYDYDDNGSDDNNIDY